MVGEWILRTAVRGWMSCTGRESASRRILRETERTLACLDAVPPEDAARPLRVPAMPGVDEDMREWSLGMLIEHNTIVNREIRGIVEALGKGERVERTLDPKTGVLPREGVGAEARTPFEDSVREYLATVQPLHGLRRTARYDHVLFGPFTAHHWHCMFGFHLMLHRRQAEAVVARL